MAVVSSVLLSENGLELQVMHLPDDVRSEGQLARTTSFALAFTHEVFGDDARDVRDAITELASDLLDGFLDMPIATDVDDADVDEDEGMGQG